MVFKVFNSIKGRAGEQKILDRIKKGDEKALELLYKKHYSMIINLIVRNSGTEDEGKDIYQEALISLWKKARSGQLIIYAKMSTYLYGVCTNLWKKELKRKKRNSYVDKESLESIKFINTGDLENREVITNCLTQLSQTCKKVLMYYYFDGRSMQEIADELGFANANTAKTKKYKCQQKFKELIQSRYAKKDLLD